MTTTFTKIFKYILFSITLAQLYSCAELTGESTGANSFLKSLTVGGIAFLEVDSNKIILDGTMDNGGDSGHNFELELDLSDNKSGSFYFFANKSLTQGIKIAFIPSYPNATITISLNGVTHSIEKELTADHRLNISLDLHNDHEDAHIIAWEAGGLYDDSEECVEEETCLYNTEFFTDPNPGPWGNQGRAPGTFWGFEGNKEMIIKLSGPLEALSNA